MKVTCPAIFSGVSKMKASRIFVVLVIGLMLVHQAVPARAAEINTNFVKDFLKRYRPSPVTFPSAAAISAQGDLIRNGQLPLTMGDMINLILQNNLDIGVNRLSPLSSLYSIDSFYRTFEPNIHFQATVNRNTLPATTVLAGASTQSSLTGQYDVGFAQTLMTGTIIGVDAIANRSSSNSTFSTLNPSWSGTLRYSFTQHLARDFGKQVNSHSIRVAKNTEKISEVAFERQLIDLVA